MSQTIGARLKQAREKRHLTLEKVSQATRIRVHQLQALEAGDLSAMASAAQARGFLRIYTDFLGLNLDALLAELQRPQAQPESGIVGPVATIPPATAEAPVPPSVEAAPLDELGTASLDELGTAPGDEFGAKPEASGEPQVKVQRGGRSRASAITTPEVEPEPQVETSLAAQASIAEQAGEQEPEAESGPRRGWLAGLGSLFRLRLRRRAESPSEAEAGEEVAAEAGETLEAASPAEAESEAPPERPVTSAEIFAQVGQQFRQRREMLSLTFDEIERHTHVRGHFLRAIEAGDFERLPSPVQTRGMLANYAAFLDLDSEALLLRFAEALQARHREKHPRPPGRGRNQPVMRASLPPLRTFIAGDLVFGLGMIVLLAVFSIWSISRITALRAQVGPEPTAPSIAEVLAATPAATEMQEITLIPPVDTPLIETTAETAATEFVAAGDGAVRLNIVAIERTFLRVIVDGKVVFDGRTVPGNAYPFEAQDRIEILAGNAAALRITYNDRDLGLLGNFGEIVHRIYTAEGIATPTATPPPTATPTPKITTTPTITPSPTPTPTPTLPASGQG